MTMTILSYSESILNPILKLIVPLMLAAGTYYFYKSGKKYGGNLGEISNYLMWGGIAGVIAFLFRFGGDYFSGWKWGESILFLIFGIISLVVALIVHSKFKTIAEAFGMTGGYEK